MRVTIATLTVFLAMGFSSFAWSAEAEIDFGSDKVTSNVSSSNDVNHRIYDMNSIDTFQTEPTTNDLDYAPSEKALEASNSHQYSLETVADTLSGESVSREGSPVCIDC